MDQIPQSIINSLLGGSLAALGWFARQIWDAIKELRSAFLLPRALQWISTPALSWERTSQAGGLYASVAYMA